jgi:hypothetical protein
LLREDAEEQQCLVVLLHAVPFDFTHDQLPELRKWLLTPEALLTFKKTNGVKTIFHVRRVKMFELNSPEVPLEEMWAKRSAGALRFPRTPFLASDGHLSD